jgi:hypothetical protein
MLVQEQSRFCLECKKTVHDLSAMTQAEAQRFLENNAEEEVCISYVPRTNGTIRSRPNPPPVIPANRLIRRRPLAAAGLTAALAACAPHGDHEALEIESEDPPAVLAVPTVIPPSEDATDEEPCETETPPVIEDHPRKMGKRAPRVKGKKIRISDRTTGLMAPPE